MSGSLLEVLLPYESGSTVVGGILCLGLPPYACTPPTPVLFFQVISSESNGRTYYVDEVDEEKRPFKALLDVGIRSTSTGCVHLLWFYLACNVVRGRCGVKRIVLWVRPRVSTRCFGLLFPRESSKMLTRGACPARRLFPPRKTKPCFGKHLLPNESLHVFVLRSNLSTLLLTRPRLLITCFFTYTRSSALVLLRSVSSSSNRVFGCMKGAADGGLDVPHNEKRFPGYDRDTKSYDVSVERIVVGSCRYRVGLLAWLPLMPPRKAQSVLRRGCWGMKHTPCIYTMHGILLCILFAAVS